MKRFMLLAAGIVAFAFLFAGCAFNGTTTKPLLPQPTLSPAQLAAAFCPAFNNAITLVTTFNAAEAAVLPIAAKANADINTYVRPIVNGACAAGATITVTDVNQLIQQGIPTLAGIVAALPLPLPTQAAIQGGFAAAELGTALVNQYENAVAVAKTQGASPASGAAAASAPAAASGVTLQ